MRRPYSPKRRKTVSKLLGRLFKDKLMRKAGRKRTKRTRKGSTNWQKSKGSSKRSFIWRMMGHLVLRKIWEERPPTEITISCQSLVVMLDRVRH